MGAARLQQKLTAILYADVAGYSRLTGDDEAGTHRRLSAYLDRVTAAIGSHRGRVVHFAGDAVLADFPTVASALVCAVAIQCELERRNADLPEERKLRFRIGVNLGDVIVDRDDIYGHGVNVAARLESLAEPGGVCISESVRAAVGAKLPLDYEYLGERAVKNIATPIAVYRVRLRPGAELPAPATVAGTRDRGWLGAAALAAAAAAIAGGLAWLQPWAPEFEPAAIDRMAYPLPEKPSIAVLAFDNLSQDPEAERYSDGISENVIAMLSKVPELFVIARNSSFSYKGRAVPPRQVAEEFGVQYVLEGSLQKQGDRIRVTALLIDALAGNHLWAETYDRTLDDFFAVQDELALEIVKSLQVELTIGKGTYFLKSATRSVDAWEAYTKALALWNRNNREDNIRARALAEQAIEHDPGWAVPYMGLGWTHVVDAFRGWSEDPEESLRLAEHFARKALAIDETLGNAYGLLANVHDTRGEHDEALAAIRRGVALDPNNPGPLMTLAYVMVRNGRPEEAIALSKKYERIQPMTPPAYLLSRTIGYYLTGRYEDALAVARRTLRSLPDESESRLYAIASAAALGRPGDARADVEYLLEQEPEFSARAAGERAVLLFKDKSFRGPLVERLIAAGLPE